MRHSKRRKKKENLFIGKSKSYNFSVKKKEKSRKTSQEDYLEFRSKILDISSILDRFERKKQEEELKKCQKIIQILLEKSKRTEKILTFLSK